jgi:ATP-dependent Clp protease adaptor protein ClpS
MTMANDAAETYQQDGDTALAERPKLERPKRWNVIFLNDDETPVEFVIGLLIAFFNKTPDDAAALAWRIHSQGSGIAGTYMLEIAEMKTLLVAQNAVSHGYPLRAGIKEE